MGFLRSILVLAGVCLCVTFAYFIGHGLSTHHAGPMLWGAGLLLAGMAILAAVSRDRVPW